jgi:dimethylargininase
MMNYALVRGVPDSFDRCIKPSTNQPIDINRARVQHRAYREALSHLGYTLLVLPPDDHYPDCPFVEDTAVVIKNRVLITFPGAPSRQGEAAASKKALQHFLKVDSMEPPATLDGGDVLQIGNKIFVGHSSRTNKKGIETLTRWAGADYNVISVPLGEGLHLKSSVNYLGKGIVIVSGGGFDSAVFSDYDVVSVQGGEAARLSFLPLGETVLLPSDCPETRSVFESRGFNTIPLDISEIRKAQAGFTCMSVLFEA